jgi:hypothetical protein
MTRASIPSDRLNRLLLSGLRSEDLDRLRFAEMEIGGAWLRWRCPSHYDGALEDRAPTRPVSVFRLRGIPLRLRTKEVVEGVCASFAKVRRCHGQSWWIGGGLLCSWKERFWWVVNCLRGPY